MRKLILVPGVLLLLVAGCARPDQSSPGGPADPGATRQAFDTRAAAVAAAWQAVTIGGAWRTGFVPLQDLTIAPKGGFPDDTMKQAFGNGWYTTAAPLPGVPFAPGIVRFADGSTMSVPLVSGRDAYGALDKGGAPPCPDGAPTGQPAPTGPESPVGAPAPKTCARLLVTEVTLGEATIRTSRGQATVPAWLFTVAKLAEPIARVAVAPSAITLPPSPDLPAPSHVKGLVTAQDLVAVDGTTVTYRLGVGACDTQIQPLVHETAEVVVVGGSVVTVGDACIDILKLEPVTVTLAKPLAARPIVDVLNGANLTVR